MTQLCLYLEGFIDHAPSKDTWRWEDQITTAAAFDSKKESRKENQWLKSIWEHVNHVMWLLLPIWGILTHPLPPTRVYTTGTKNVTTNHKVPSTSNTTPFNLGTAFPASSSVFPRGANRRGLDRDADVVIMCLLDCIMMDECEFLKERFCKGKWDRRYFMSVLLGIQGMEEWIYVTFHGKRFVDMPQQDGLS
jgi:hypothetical protein